MLQVLFYVLSSETVCHVPLSDKPAVPAVSLVLTCAEELDVSSPHVPISSGVSSNMDTILASAGSFWSEDCEGVLPSTLLLRVGDP